MTIKNCSATTEKKPLKTAKNLKMTINSNEWIVFVKIKSQLGNIQGD